MSANPDPKPATPAPPRLKQPDPRARRTRDTLGDALVQLIQEKPFDDITVQEVLDRAGVGRTTFYTHFRDKQDLFLSDVEDFFEMLSTILTRRAAPPSRIAPVEEFFTHVAEVRVFHDALIASGKFADIRELGIGFFARSIEQRLASAHPGPKQDLRATAHALAGTLFSLLEWWIRHQETTTPAAMDALFHRLVWQGIAPPPSVLGA